MYLFPLQKIVKPVLTSRSVLLGDLQENHFVSVVCGKGPLSKNCYVLTRSGQLCLFDDKRRLDRFTEVKVSEICCVLQKVRAIDSEVPVPGLDDNNIANRWETLTGTM